MFSTEFITLYLRMLIDTGTTVNQASVSKLPDSTGGIHLTYLKKHMRQVPTPDSLSFFLRQ